MVALLAAGAVVLAGCSAPGPPEVTFFADGDSTTAAPLIHCDALVRSCDRGGEPATLKLRPGRPVQVSVPTEVYETPWLVNVQYLDADGTPRTTQAEFFSRYTQRAYTVEPPAGAQVLVVEIQQVGAAYQANAQGEPVLDENGEPQLVLRGVWSLQIEPAA